MDYIVLNEELVSDPLVRGYSGMSDLEAADDLNTVYRTRELTSLDGGVIYDQVDRAEYLALGVDDQDEVWKIASLGANIPVYPGSKARARFVEIFGGASASITNLQDAITSDISRGVEIGVGSVAEGHVTKARAIGG